MVRLIVVIVVLSLLMAGVEMDMRLEMCRMLRLVARLVLRRRMLLSLVSAVVLLTRLTPCCRVRLSTSLAPPPCRLCVVRLVCIGAQRRVRAWRTLPDSMSGVRNFGQIREWGYLSTYNIVRNVSLDCN